MEDQTRRNFLRTAALGAAGLAGIALGCGKDTSRKLGASEVGDRDFERPEDNIQKPNADYSTRGAFLIYSNSLGNDADGTAYRTGLQLVDAAGVSISGETIDSTNPTLMTPQAFIQRYFNLPSDAGQDNVRSAMEAAFVTTILTANGLPNRGQGREIAYSMLEDTFKALTNNYATEVLGGREQSYSLDMAQNLAFGHLSNGDAYAAFPIKTKQGNLELWVAVQGQVPNGMPAAGRRYGTELDDGVSRVVALEQIMGD